MAKKSSSITIPDSIKAEVRRKMGSKWSARHSQHGVRLMKKRGMLRGKAKPKNSKLAKWRRENWITLSPSSKDGFARDSNGKIKSCGNSKTRSGATSRCLPMKAARNLSASERKATARKKIAKGKSRQFVSNTSKAKKAGRRARN
ncbi:MAG: hypothetical protein AAF378_18215 [Cyanobacteria bacterium P01_A01_bin.84]